MKVSDINMGRHFRTTPKGIMFLKDYEKICSYFQSITEEEAYEDSESLSKLPNYTNRWAEGHCAKSLLFAV